MFVKPETPHNYAYNSQTNTWLLNLIQSPSNRLALCYGGNKSSTVQLGRFCGKLLCASEVTTLWRYRNECIIIIIIIRGKILYSTALGLVNLWCLFQINVTFFKQSTANIQLHDTP